MKKLFYILLFRHLGSIYSAIFIRPTSALDNLTEEDIFNITAQPKDFPLVMRRTTLIVRDLDTSLKLYRDAMGMEVIYDNKLPRPRKDGKEGMQTLRLVFLKATHKYYGVLGLMEYY